MGTETRWLHRRGALARDGWETVVDATIPGWRHTGLRIATLGGGRELPLPAGVETVVVPLSGSFDVIHGPSGDRPTVTGLRGRPSVFDGPTDVLYLSAAEVARVRGDGRVAVATSPTREPRPTRYVRADEVAVELRGAGASSRQVHNIATPETLDAARLIVCEVITPAGNWSSYPPHKHDEHRPGRESRLEEIYYFEAVPTAPVGMDGAFGLFSTASSEAGEIEIEGRVRSGDVALVPYGYHGPAVAAPGYDLYYLNVMAGPDDERAWLISDDPAHAWVRGTWDVQEIDPRLPFGAKKEGAGR